MKTVNKMLKTLCLLLISFALNQCNQIDQDIVQAKKSENTESACPTTGLQSCDSVGGTLVTANFSALDVYKAGILQFRSDTVSVLRRCNSDYIAITQNGNLQPGSLHLVRANLGYSKVFFQQLIDLMSTTCPLRNATIDGDLQNFSEITAGEYKFKPVRNTETH